VIAFDSILAPAHMGERNRQFTHRHANDWIERYGPVGVEKVKLRKMLKKTFAECLKNDDLNFLDIFYPQIVTRFERNWTFSTPTRDGTQ
jgi:hypothetical protein